MSEARHSDANASLRIDRLLVYLRFARTRSAARTLIENGVCRLNRAHVSRVSEAVSAGDVLTFAQGGQVRIIEILHIPDRRAAPARAREHYRERDRS